MNPASVPPSGRRARARASGCADLAWLPDLASLAALRAWHEGFTARAAVTRYLSHVRNDGQSSRGVLARIRRQLAACALERQRDDLVPLFTQLAADRTRHAAAVVHANALIASDAVV